MFKVFLVNMPFATLNLPSLALSQLQAVLRSRYPERVTVDVLYLNQEFAEHLGLELYQYIVDSLEANNTGLGDWFFRQAAFPWIADNTQQYFQRYFPSRSAERTDLKRRLLEKREGLEGFLERVINRHRLDEANLIGLTSMFQQNLASFAMARKIKERRPDSVTVMGGANCETPMGEEIVTHVKSIDFVFSGPALISFADFVQHLLEGRAELSHSIRGLYSKTNCCDPGQAARGSIGEELDIGVRIDLDYEPFLDALERNFPESRIPPRINFETSRGCWWGERAHCTFCGLNGTTMNYRAMQPALAIEQFHSLFRRFADRCQRFEAVDNILPRNYVRDVLPYLDTPPGVSLFYEVKADLAEADIQVLAKAGVTEIQPGIESLATSTLKLMKKGTTVFTNLLLLKHCRSHGVFPLWNLLVGFPGEGEEVYEKYLSDLPLLTHLSPPDGVHPVRFDRFSPYFMRAAEYGLDLHPYDYYELIYPFAPQTLSNLAYYFMDHNIGADYFTCMAKWIDRLTAAVKAWRARWEVQDPSLLPDVSFREREGGVVYDSRPGMAVEHEVGEVGRKILESLTGPHRLTQLDSQLTDLRGLDVEKEVARLQALGLIFQEGDRFLSLVLPQTPRPSRGRTLIYGLQGVQT